MLFNSLPFLYIYLPVVLIVFSLLKTKNQKYVWLAGTGYFFYSFWNLKFCLLMAFSTLVSYLAGLALLRISTPRGRKIALVIPIVVDLTVLAVFKYADFGLGILNKTASILNIGWHADPLNILLPVGISFYTFHTITYVVDAYRGVIKPTKNLAEFACYVSLFPQLVAGPIVRFREIEKDLDDIESGQSREGWSSIGWSYFILGLSKKVLLADNIAALINPALADWANLSTPMAWICAIGYTYQLYFDFSGYSDMAIGLGYLLGLRLPQNFNSPYKALDPSDFWRRWHISLSTVLRDYLYIPLGGNRGTSFQVNRNLLLTMLLGGLWHGANWTFLVWGAYHGLLLILYRSSKHIWDELDTTLRRTATFLLVLIGWIIFRSDNLAMASAWLSALVSFRPEAGAQQFPLLSLFALVIAAFVAHGMPNCSELRHPFRLAGPAALATLLVITMVMLYNGQPSPFLYFQF
jgi:alginate O-acetyltransferase complex protein AlgI